MSTKAEHINSAYSQLRISGITVDPTPEDTKTALWRLEDMLWDLHGRTMDLNYNFEDSPKSTSDSGIERVFNHMIATNLAVRLLPDFGKDATPELTSQARASMTGAVSVLARKRLQGVQYPSRMPVGSGNTYFANRQRYFYSSAPAITSASNAVMICGEISDFFESFTGWLMDEDISSYTITVDDGLELVTGIEDPLAGSPFAPPVSDYKRESTIYYRVQADACPYAGSPSVVVQITTSTGRIEKRSRLIEVKAE